MIVILCMGLLLAGILFLIRNNWVLKNRLRWIDHHVYHFDKNSCSYERMLWTFWIWDMKKFGFDPRTQKSWEQEHQEHFASIYTHQEI